MYLKQIFKKEIINATTYLQTNLYDGNNIIFINY